MLVWKRVKKNYERVFSLLELWEIKRIQKIIGVEYIPLTNRVKGPYCNLWTKFFPAVDLWPKHKAHRP